MSDYPRNLKTGHFTPRRACTNPDCDCERHKPKSQTRFTPTATTVMAGGSRSSKSPTPAPQATRQVAPQTESLTSTPPRQNPMRGVKKLITPETSGRKKRGGKASSKKNGAQRQLEIDDNENGEDADQDDGNPFGVNNGVGKEDDHVQDHTADGNHHDPAGLQPSHERPQHGEQNADHAADDSHPANFQLNAQHGAVSAMLTKVGNGIKSCFRYISIIQALFALFVVVLALWARTWYLRRLVLIKVAEELEVPE